MLILQKKILKIPDFSCLFSLITMILFLFIQLKGFKSNMGFFGKFLKIFPTGEFTQYPFFVRFRPFFYVFASP